jgi:adhesin/invasin
MRIRLRHLLLACSTLLALPACGSDSSGTTPGVTYTMVAVAGNNQVGLWSDTTAIRPAVKITDNAGQPVAGVVVTFAASGPTNGTVLGATQTTGADGVATVGGWKLGTPGTSMLAVSAVGVSNSPIDLTATSKDQLQISRSAGTNQSATVRTAVTTPPTIQVSGLYTQAVIAGAMVTFSVTGGGGSVTRPTTTTDANGVARVGSWTLGPMAGVNQLTVVVTWPGSWSTTFAATGTP